MSVKEFDVTCPSCRARLSVDVLTEKVVRWRAAGSAEAPGRGEVGERDWDSAMGRVQGRLGEGADRFDASLERERRRSRDLDELFDELRRERPADEEGDEDERKPDEGSGGR